MDAIDLQKGLIFNIVQIIIDAILMKLSSK